MPSPIPGCTAIVGDIRTSMLEEVDFTKEAQHLAQFSAYLDRAGLRRVATCPGVYRQFSSKRCVPVGAAGGCSCLEGCTAGLGWAGLGCVAWRHARAGTDPLCPHPSLTAPLPQGDGHGPAAGRAAHRPGRRAQHH